MDGQFQSVDALRQLPIRAQNTSTGAFSTIRLEDIATIERAYVDPPTVMVRHQGRQVIALGVSMSKGGDIIRLGKNLDKTVASIKAGLPVGIELSRIQDQPKAVERSVSEFVKVLVEAVVIVLAVSFISLGLHFRPLRLDIWPGLVVAITIPLVLAITFVTMFYWGIGLHKISLGSLIIALGLLVDDAIIAVEMMVRKLEEGHDKRFAATYAYEVTAMPMLTGTLITAAGFLPIGLAQSSVGEYTYAIFAVTTAALLISWVASVYFVPYLGARLLHTHAKVEGQAHELFDTPFYASFRKLVNWCVAHRWLTIGATIVVFALGVVGMGKVQQQFFPDSSRPEILVDLWLPEGATVQGSNEVAKRFEARLSREPGVESVTTWVGTGVPRFYLPLDVIFDTSNVSQAIVLPKSLADRETLRKKLPRILAEEFSDVRGRVKLLPNGPPVPYPVQFRVDGPKTRPWYAAMGRPCAGGVARQTPACAASTTTGTRRSRCCAWRSTRTRRAHWASPARPLRRRPAPSSVGSTIGQYREADRTIDIVLRQPLDERNAITDLRGAYLPTASGRSVPLAQVAKVGFRLGERPDVARRPHLRHHGPR